MSDQDNAFFVVDLPTEEYADVSDYGLVQDALLLKKTSPSYSLVSEKLRQLSSSSARGHRLQCSVFCGGKACKYDSASHWEEEDMAIRGLFSHWVTEKVLAMARPSSELFKQHQLVQQFKDAGIRSVVNLQTAGEHAHCGTGLVPGGFSYQPEELMSNDVYYYNYGWTDYSAPSLEAIMDVVKVMDFSCSEGKVAVHCHAGLGRTGVLIACYLVYSRRISADSAITIVREKRPGSIQTRAQLELIRQFSSHLCSLWRLYPTPSISLSLPKYLERQASLLHGEDARRFRYIPKVLHAVCSRLRELKSSNSYTFACMEEPPATGETNELGECMDESEEVELQSSVGVNNGCVSGEGSGCVPCTSDSHQHLLLSLLLVSPCCRYKSVREKVTQLEEEMNSVSQWTELAQERDMTVLFILLANFFIRMSEPMVTVSRAFSHCSPVNLIQNLPSAVRQTLILTLDTVKEVVPALVLKENVHQVTGHLFSLFLHSNKGGVASADDITSQALTTLHFALTHKLTG